MCYFCPIHLSITLGGIAGVPCSIHGSVRLVGGTNNHTGRVELCVVDEWSPLCDHGWSVRDAEVACRQLGLTTVGEYSYEMSSSCLCSTEGAIVQCVVCYFSTTTCMDNNLDSTDTVVHYWTIH